MPPLPLHVLEAACLSLETEVRFGKTCRRRLVGVASEPQIYAVVAGILDRCSALASCVEKRLAGCGMVRTCALRPHGLLATANRRCSITSMASSTLEAS